MGIIDLKGAIPENGWRHSVTVGSFEVGNKDFVEAVAVAFQMT